MLPRYWTISALYCLEIKSNCEICKIAGELETLPEKCKMKDTLKTLIKKYGYPSDYNLNL